MTTSESLGGRSALVVGHVAGMIDLVALPVWVGTLIQRYDMSPPQAGGLATLFLIGAVIASLFFAPRFNDISGRVVAPAGFAVAAIAFFILSMVDNYAMMALLHVVGGLAIGSALSFTHGTIGRTSNPHRLFAAAQIALGLFGVIFLGATPNIVNAFGGPSLFYVFAGVMLVAAIATAIGFPAVSSVAVARSAAAAKFSAATWFAIVGVMLMALIQAMMFSFVQQIGIDRGFGADKVNGVLIVLGLINLTPGLIAALLQKRLPATSVALIGPVVQAIFAVAISTATTFIPYAVPMALFAFVMIFTHTFVFGLLARIEPTNRAVASTPAMLMIGAAMGPFLGGALVVIGGYPALGVAAIVFAAIAVFCFFQTRTKVRAADTAALHGIA